MMKPAVEGWEKNKVKGQHGSVASSKCEINAPKDSCDRKPKPSRIDLRMKAICGRAASVAELRGEGRIADDACHALRRGTRRAELNASSAGPFEL